MNKNVYLYNGKEFHSIKALANYVGINEKTLTKRLQRGLDIESACQKRKLSARYITEGVEEKYLAEVCGEQEKDCALVRNRLKYGYSLDEALNKPKKISKQGKPIIVNGVLYNSISAAVRKLNLEDKENTIRSRLGTGKNPNMAFFFKD